MINREEKVQNLNTNFKIKIKRREDLPGIGMTAFTVNITDSINNKGIYTTMKNGTRVKYSKLSLKEVEEALTQLFYGREIKNKENEYRKEFSIGSKIFKQTYKFRQSDI
jgi:hypothetical protein